MTADPVDLEHIHYSVRDGAAWIRLDRPEVLNAFDSTMYRNLGRAVRQAEDDRRVDAIVITGTGRAFATGGDLDDASAVVDPDAPLAGWYEYEDALPFDALRRCTKPTIAAVNGICYAGGLIAAATCDIAIATASSRFCIPEARVGLAEPILPAVLSGRVGLSKAIYYTLTARPFDAAEAERAGFITEMVADGELEHRVGEVIGELRLTSPAAKRRYKEFFARHMAPVDLRGIREGIRGPDGVEGLTAFAEGREPRWSAGPDPSP